MKNLTTIILLLLAVNASSQNLAGRKILMRPKEIKRPTETVAATLKHSGTDKGIEPWLVYSDKKPNYSFKSPGGFETFKSLEFLEQFYVIDEKGEYLNIAKASTYDPKTHELEAEAVDYGWIKKNDLLLWPHCIVTDAGQIEKKAMIMNTVDLIKTKRLNIKELEADAIDFYYSSALRKKEKTGRESRIFEVFFAFKITDTAVLLGNKARVASETEKAVKDLILGWVPRNRIVIWDHRVAVEPNWTEAAVKERKQNNIKAAIFPERQDAENYSEKKNTIRGSIMDEKSIKGDFYETRMVGEWFRYTVYNEHKGIMNLGVTGEINTTKGEIDKVTKALFDRDVNIATSKLRNINLVFVIDGTNSMQPYINSVSKAIIKSMKELERIYPEETYNIIRFGAVVYRDYAENKRLIETKELSAKYDDIANFLNKIEAKDYFDKDHPEAVYYGLKTALRGLLTNEDETNVIILVGDAGNHKRKDPSQVNEDELVEMIAEKKCAFLAFQVHNAQDPSYDDFRTQVQRFMLKAAEKLYKQIKSELIEGYDIEKPEWRRIQQNTLRLDNYVNLATLIYADKNQTMDTQILIDEIVEIVYKNVERTDETVQKIARVVSEGRSLKEVMDNPSVQLSSSKYVSSFNPALLHFFFNSLNIEKDKLEFICDKKYQLHTDGYAALNVENMEYPLFKKVLLLSRTDLSKINDFIDRLYNSTNQHNKRMALQEAFKEMLNRHIGYIDSRELMNMTIEEINSKIVGLPGTNSFINTIKLQDITNPGVLPDSELNEYARGIDSKREKIRRIYNESSHNPYEYSLRLNEEPYYWIEDDLLP